MSKISKADSKNIHLKPYSINIKKHDELLKFFLDLNVNVMYDLFFGSVLEERNIMNYKIHYEETKTFDPNVFYNNHKYPLFLGQMGLLYSYNKIKYKGILNEAFLNFLALNFRDNIVFIVSGEGFLLEIMLLQITKTQRIMVNQFFNDNIEELDRYQYLSIDYNPKLEKFKLIKAKTKLNEKVEDAVLTFS